MVEVSDVAFTPLRQEVEQLKNNVDEIKTNQTSHSVATGAKLEELKQQIRVLNHRVDNLKNSVEILALHQTEINNIKLESALTQEIINLVQAQVRYSIQEHVKVHSHLAWE